MTKNSSPNRRRKLSLNIPIITGGKALDLAALSCSSNGYASMYSTMSPFSKTTLDINKLYVSSPVSSKIPDEGEDKKDKVEDTTVSKQGKSRGANHQHIIPILTCRNHVFIDLWNGVMIQISLFEKKVTTIRTRVMTGTQKPLPPSHLPPRKTSKAKTQVHCVLNMCGNVIFHSLHNQSNSPANCTLLRAIFTVLFDHSNRLHCMNKACIWNSLWFVKRPQKMNIGIQRFRSLFMVKFL